MAKARAVKIGDSFIGVTEFAFIGVEKREQNV
jgi:hypothetical protein